jgi:hypothetical protein
MQMNTANLKVVPQPPRPGDIGICGACGRIMIFMEHGLVRNPTKEEARLIGQNVEVMTIRKDILDRL